MIMSYIIIWIATVELKLETLHTWVNAANSNLNKLTITPLRLD